MGFGRTPGHIHNVLAVLGDGAESMAQTLASAIELAEAERARLTLVKTCPAGRTYVWVAPFAAGGAYVPPALESPEEACRILGRMAEGVPKCVPLTMRVLDCDTQRSLLKLLRTGDFGAVVAEQALLSRCWRLRRQLRREGVVTVQVGAAARAGNGDRITRRRRGRSAEVDLAVRGLPHSLGQADYT